MPEGPEVRIIADCLAKLLTGKWFITLEYDGASRYAKKPLQDYIHFVEELPAKVMRVFSKGKKIVISLENGLHLMSSLGMEGHWVLNPEAHSNLWINTGSYQENLLVLENTVYFDDSRHFGTIEVLLNDKELESRLKEIGPDLLNDDITDAMWLGVVRRPRIGNKQICDFLLEQKYFSGIGNYLRAEILYRAKVRPDRTLNQITDCEHALILKCSRDIIQESYEKRGYTLKTFWDMDGQKGSFETVVYGKSKDPQGYPVRKDTFKDGRTMHWVPEVQV